MKIFYLTFALMLTGCFGNAAQSPATSKSTPIVVAVDTIAADTLSADTIAADTLPVGTVVAPDPIKHTDINGDGLIDTVIVYENVGSQFSGLVVEISDGEHWWITGSTENDQALVTMYRTDITDKRIRDTVYKIVMPAEIRTKFDPVATWVMNAQLSHRKVKSDYFYYVSKPKFTWRKSKKIDNENYRVKIDPQLAISLGKLRESFCGISAPSSAQSKHAWWVRRRFWQLDNPLKEVGTIGTSKIFASNLIVTIENGDKQAVLFMCDYYAMGGDRGEIENIEDIKIVKDRYLIVTLNRGMPPNMYLIDTQRGVFAKMRKTRYDMEDDPTLIDVIIKEHLKL